MRCARTLAAIPAGTEALEGWAGRGKPSTLKCQKYAAQALLSHHSLLPNPLYMPCRSADAHFNGILLTGVAMVFENESYIYLIRQTRSLHLGVTGKPYTERTG